MKVLDLIKKPEGSIQGTIFYKNGKIEEFGFKNTVVETGTEAMAMFLAGERTPKITNMLFGDGATGKNLLGMTKKNEMFGVVKANKKIVGQIDPDARTQVLFVAELEFDELVNSAINEMALQMDNSNLFSLATFPDLYKTDQMRIIWRWYLAYV